MTLRIGILGAARVATYALIEAATDVAGVHVAGVAARDPHRARTYAEEHGILNVYPGYQALIEADEIDAVYVALPPALHAEWSIAAVAAGKPVLCEKPFTLDPAQVEAMIEAEASTGKLIMEAQHSHYHPLSARMREVVQSGQLGKIEQVESVFTVPIPDAVGDHRYDAAMGGGALWDLGLYAAYWIRSATGEEPVVVSADERRHVLGADIATTATLSLPSGGTATLNCAMDLPVAATLRVQGTDGVLDIINPLAPQRGHAFTVTDAKGHQTHEEFPVRASYCYQLDAFRDAVVDGAPVPTRGADSLATIRLLDAIRATARKG